MDRQTEGQRDGWKTVGQRDGWENRGTDMDGRTIGQTDRQMDKKVDGITEEQTYIQTDEQRNGWIGILLEWKMDRQRDK